MRAGRGGTRHFATRSPRLGGRGVARRRTRCWPRRLKLLPSFGAHPGRPDVPTDSMWTQVQQLLNSKPYRTPLTGTFAVETGLEPATSCLQSPNSSCHYLDWSRKALLRGHLF